MKFSKICVLGMGYIGLPTASTFAMHGLQVVGVDVKRNIIETLQRGELHIHEPGLHSVVKQALASGNLRVSLKPEEADAFIIAVPTPFHHDKTADLSFVRSATEAIVPYLRKGNLVVLESTSPPQTTEQVVVPLLEKSGLRAGEDFLVCYSPERVLPGKILQELVENARVIGGIDAASARAGAELYKTFVRGEIIQTTATTAEMVKLMENTYRDINIAIANEFSRLAERFDVNIWEAIQIANLHPRVKILNPGVGVGGHCISVDPWFLVEKAPELTPLIKTAREVNDSQPAFVARLVEEALGGTVDKKKIAVLGLAYKANVDDIRESPAIDVVELLADLGAEVKAYEPNKPGATIDKGVVTHSLSDAVNDAQVIVFLVAHSPFKAIEPAYMATISPTRLVIDAVQVLDADKWRDQGFTVIKLGDGKFPISVS
jgi:UDP-N-acetyl-D-mannosaminuronic acid dehydrogenase